MTRSVPRVSAITLGVAAFVSLAPFSAAFADSSAEPAPTPSRPVSTPAPVTSASAPTLSEPAPTPGWAESGLGGTTVAQHASGRSNAHRHYAARTARRYGDNPMVTAASGVAGGVADLGSIAAYPFYCFPNYGSCSVRVPYRY
jgi:hypothetical protein